MSPLVVEDSMVQNQTMIDQAIWVQEIRFAIEGVTQGIVGLAGLIGKQKSNLMEKCFYYKKIENPFHLFHRQFHVNRSLVSSRHGSQADFHANPHHFDLF